MALRKAKIVYNFGLSDCNTFVGLKPALYEKDLLQGKQILLRVNPFGEGESKMTMVELLPMKVYQFTLTLKAPNKNCRRGHFSFYYFYLSKKIRLDFSCESSA